MAPSTRYRWPRCAARRRALAKEGNNVPAGDQRRKRRRDRGPKGSLRSDASDWFQRRPNAWLVVSWIARPISLPLDAKEVSLLATRTHLDLSEEAHVSRNSHGLGRKRECIWGVAGGTESLLGQSWVTVVFHPAHLNAGSLRSLRAHKEKKT